MTEEVKVTQADKLCAQAIRESVSAATSDMIAARHRIAAQAELLEALNLAVAYLSEVPHEPAMKIAKAIAKAKGEA